MNEPITDDLVMEMFPDAFSNGGCVLKVWAMDNGGIELNVHTATSHSVVEFPGVRTVGDLQTFKRFLGKGA